MDTILKSANKVSKYSIVIIVDNLFFFQSEAKKEKNGLSSSKIQALLGIDCLM